jgi:hypothetical protein
MGVVLAGTRASAQDMNSLNRAIDLLHNGSFEKAAPIFFDVAENSGQQELQFRAEWFLALSLYKLGLFHSALYYDSIIIDEGPNHPYYLKAVENTLDVMDAVGDKAAIPSLLDHYYNDSFSKLPKQTIDRINFLVALWGHNQRHYEDSTAFLDAVKPDSRDYPRARYLRGIQYAQDAKNGESKLNEKAAALFEQVRKLESNDRTPYADLQEMKNLSTLALARVRYAQGKYLDAYELYAQIPRYSRQWRDALFEGAYAAYMGDDNGRSLGMLHTLHSPVAGDQFVPESWLLKGLLYYDACLFDESRAALAHLQDTYSTQTLGQLKAILSQKHDPDFYYALLTKGAVGDVKMPANVRNELLTDDSITGRRSYVAELSAEQEKLQNIESWKATTLRKALIEAVGQQRAKLVQTAGIAIRRGMGILQLKLEDLDGQAEIVKLEMADREKNLLEANYDGDKLLVTQTLNRPATPPGVVEYWGFDGEYWPDELGYYQYTVKNACPAETADTTAPGAQ